MGTASMCGSQLLMQISSLTAVEPDDRVHFTDGETEAWRGSPAQGLSKPGFGLSQMLLPAPWEGKRAVCTW